MKMNRWLVPAALALAASTAGAQQLVVNGGFETGSLSGWTETGNSGFSDVSTGLAHSGTYGAYFGPIGTVGGIMQSLTTAVGARYNVSFWLQSSGDTPSSFSWLVNGASQLTLTNSPAANYAQYIGSFIASSTSTQLQFNFRNDAGYWYMDDVSVLAAVPEPATWALMLAGVGLSALVARRGRRIT